MRAWAQTMRAGGHEMSAKPSKDRLCEGVMLRIDNVRCLEMFQAESKWEM